MIPIQFTTQPANQETQPIGLPPRFPQVAKPFPWYPPHDRSALRVGLLFKIPMPSGSGGMASFRLSHFKATKNKYSIQSKHAHPLEATHVSGSGVCGYFETIERFCSEAIIEGYYPHHVSDSREEQFEIHALYEADHGLPPIAQQCLEAIPWEGWFTLEELRHGESAAPAVSLEEAKKWLKALGASYVQGRSQLIEIGQWEPCGSPKDLFLYEVTDGGCLIEHINPNSPLAGCGVQPGAWAWTTIQSHNHLPCADRLEIQIGAKNSSFETRTFLLDGTEIGGWSCLQSMQRGLGGRFRGNLLCEALGLSAWGEGYEFEHEIRLLQKVAPYRIFDSVCDRENLA